MSFITMDTTSSIPAFFAGRSIFVTGGTGFMGKVLIEKLLRSCPEIREIFLLMRSKKGVSIDNRLRKMLENPLFDRVKAERPRSTEKLIPVSGDAMVEGLGLGPVERKVIIDRVSIIFHVAASVRFDDNLKSAVFMNLRSTRDICILAAQMKSLVALVHVSSTYTHSDKPTVEEKIYPSVADWKKTIKIAENLDDHTLRILTPKILGNFPNTYTFTKRVAEQVVADYSNTLPSVIFRPSIVISTLSEPVKGWLDNFNGPVGMMIGGGKGVVRVICNDPKQTSDFMPVDIAIKAMISATWKRGTTTITKDPSVHVYNCANCGIKCVTTAEMIGMGLRFTEDIPLEGVLWYPNTIMVPNRIVHYFLTIILHLLPALVIDTVLKLAGKPPILVKLQRKIYTANSALDYFMTNQWIFRNNNFLKLLSELPKKDMDSFGYDFSTANVHDYFKACLTGAKTYLLNEDMNKLDEAKLHFNRMKRISQCFNAWCVFVGTWILYRYGFFSMILNFMENTITDLTAL